MRPSGRYRRKRRLRLECGLRWRRYGRVSTGRARVPSQGNFRWRIVARILAPAAPTSVLESSWFSCGRSVKESLARPLDVVSCETAAFPAFVFGPVENWRWRGWREPVRWLSLRSPANRDSVGRQRIDRRTGTNTTAYTEFSDLRNEPGYATVLMGCQYVALAPRTRPAANPVSVADPWAGVSLPGVLGMSTCESMYVRSICGIINNVDKNTF